MSWLAGRATGTLLIVLMAWVATTADATQPSDAIPDHARAATVGDVCLACGHRVTGADIAFQHHGRWVVLHTGQCSDHWALASDRIFAALEPHSALFEERAILGGQMASGWLLFGIYVVAGLACGAACGYIAVSRGFAVLPWFAAGMVGTLIALALIWRKPAADLTTLPGGMPGGLTKVPVTRLPRDCPACGATMHPAARRCPACHASLSPLVDAETSRL